MFLFIIQTIFATENYSRINGTLNVFAEMASFVQTLYSAKSLSSG